MVPVLSQSARTPPRARAPCAAYLDTRRQSLQAIAEASPCSEKPPKATALPIPVDLPSVRSCVCNTCVLLARTAENCPIFPLRSFRPVFTAAPTVVRELVRCAGAAATRHLVRVGRCDHAATLITGRDHRSPDSSTCINVTRT